MLTRFRRNVKIYFCFQLAYIVPKRPEAVLKASVLIKKKGKTVSYVILASSPRLGNPSDPVRKYFSSIQMEKEQFCCGHRSVVFLWKFQSALSRELSRLGKPVFI